MRLRLKLWARIPMEDLKVQINNHKPRQPGDDEDGENQLLGWEQRLGLVKKYIENI